MYKPTTPFNTAARICKVSSEKINGITTKTFTPSNTIIYCSVKSYGGTELQINNVLAVEDTRVIQCYYTPDITAADCLVFPAESETEKWEIITPPENLEMRNQYLQFKVKRIKGGA